MSDRKLRAAIDDGVASFDELQFEFGVATCCGKCEASIRDLMAQSGVCANDCAVEPVPAFAPLTFYARKAA